MDTFIHAIHLVFDNDISTILNYYSFTGKETVSPAGEMPQPIRVLLPKHKKLSSNPQSPRKKPDMVTHASLTLALYVERNRRGSGAWCLST